MSGEWQRLDSEAIVWADVANQLRRCGALMKTGQTTVGTLCLFSLLCPQKGQKMLKDEEEDLPSKFFDECYESKFERFRQAQEERSALQEADDVLEAKEDYQTCLAKGTACYLPSLKASAALIQSQLYDELTTCASRDEFLSTKPIDQIDHDDLLASSCRPIYQNLQDEIDAADRDHIRAIGVDIDYFLANPQATGFEQYFV
eukprot:TRINITY_DN530_c0_g1_i1.p1 TRINITY_DN530_c0_g1~~TRINITY_DN530_c0_g1_i1.p1  ORF type:complete len:202 (+),score=29.42 TRINITY_DN530_c0_g1_i1:91-696(+)